MPKARETQVSLADTPYYHCVSRCVRRSFLCGKDAVTGNDYEHRRQWVEDRLLSLGQVYSIDVCAYAVMSNHTHVVVYIDSFQASNWSVQEVLERWHRLHKGTLLTQAYVQPELRKNLNKAQLDSIVEVAEVYRRRLYDLSWFMRDLNEFIAREANGEDGCTGRFWEGRFKSQALLDEAALAACMAYVDLNPVRAKMAKTPEKSAHTSVAKRVDSAVRSHRQPKSLMPFIGNPRQNSGKGLPFKFADYLQLVEMTGRVVRFDKRGVIDAGESPILSRLGIDECRWLTLTTRFEQCFQKAAGREGPMQYFCVHMHQKNIHGISQAKALFR